MVTIENPAKRLARVITKDRAASLRRLAVLQSQANGTRRVLGR